MLDFFSLLENFPQFWNIKGFTKGLKTQLWQCKAFEVTWKKKHFRNIFAMDSPKPAIFFFFFSSFFTNMTFQIKYHNLDIFDVKWVKYSIGDFNALSFFSHYLNKNLYLIPTNSKNAREKSAHVLYPENIRQMNLIS